MKSMVKKIKDVSFTEFDMWTNQRCCDGQWSLNTAIVCSNLVSRVFDETSHIFLPWRKIRKQEELFQKYKQEYLNIDAEINLEEF